MVEWLVAFTAVPVPVLGCSGHWICAGEKGSKGQ